MFVVSIHKQSRRLAQVKVTFMPDHRSSFYRVQSNEFQRSKIVASSFGNVENKARKVARKMIRDWQKSLNQNNVRFTVEA